MRSYMCLSIRTGIIFEFLSPVIWLVFEKCTYIMYIYISFVCESCCISSLLQLFSLDRSWAFIAIAAAAAIRFCDGGLFPIAIVRHMMRGLKKETLLEAYRLTTDLLLLYVQARTNLCKLLISSTSSTLVCSTLLLSTSRKQWISSLYAQECCDCLCSTLLIITIIEALLSPSSCCKAPGPSSHYISSMPSSSHSHPLEPPRVRTRYRTFAGLHRPRA